MFPASPWLSGERLGALELLAVVVSKWDGARKHLAVSRPEFLALMERIEADSHVAPVFACGFNRSMQHTRICVSRRSVADDPKISYQLYGRPEGFDVGALAERRISPPDRPIV
jgi:hypothetical protein